MKIIKKGSKSYFCCLKEGIFEVAVTPLKYYALEFM